MWVGACAIFGLTSLGKLFSSIHCCSKVASHRISPLLSRVMTPKRFLLSPDSEQLSHCSLLRKRLLCWTKSYQFSRFISGILFSAIFLRHPLPCMRVRYLSFILRILYFHRPPPSNTVVTCHSSAFKLPRTQIQMEAHFPTHVSHVSTTQMPCFLHHVKFLCSALAW